MSHEILPPAPDFAKLPGNRAGDAALARVAAHREEDASQT